MKKKSLLLTAVATLGLTAATMAQNVPNYVPTNSLVGWWPFNGNANDESGNNLNGSVLGANLTSDRNNINNASYDFSFLNAGWGSQNNEVYIPDSPLLDVNQITVSVWIYPRSYFWPGDPNNPNSTILNRFQYGYSNPNGQAWGIGFNATSVTGGIVGTNGTGGSSAVSNTALTLNQWHHIVMTYDLSNIKLFVDGVLSATQPYNGAMNTSGNSGISIGESNQANGYWTYTDGKIDDIGMWSRALTQQEISTLYNASNCFNNTAITPQNNSLSIGNTATFTASTSDPNPSYLWQSDFGQGFQTLNNFGNYSGTNTNALTISNIQLSNHTQPIRVITLSGNCIDTSNVATITIADTCINTINDTTFITVTYTLIINTNITGINPPSNINTIKVFPNPANDHITIDYGNFATMNGYQLVIENSIGQQVFQTNITQQSNYLSLVTWGGNGLYFVHIIDPQGNTIDIRKIVLQ